MVVCSMPPPLAPFLPSGMTKTTPDTTLNNSAYSQITGWNADTSTYPGSTVSSDGVVAQGPKTATCAASIVVTSAGSTEDCTLRLKLNGTVIATGSPVSVPGLFSNIAVTVSTTTAVAPGDVLTVEAITGSYSGNLTVVSNASSYVRIT